jgi:hypothetical protein
MTCMDTNSLEVDEGTSRRRFESKSLLHRLFLPTSILAVKRRRRDRRPARLSPSLPSPFPHFLVRRTSTVTSAVAMLSTALTAAALFLFAAGPASASPCVAMDADFNLYAFGLNSKDWNAGAQTQWGTSKRRCSTARMKQGVDELLHRRCCQRHHHDRTPVSCPLSTRGFVTLTGYR